MKKRVVYKVGVFEDFSGVERQVVLCAVSTPETTSTHKFLSIGVAVQSPCDEIRNEELAKKIALGKAEKRPVGELITTNPGMINTKVVDALLEQELKYFKENPGKYLAGYNKDKQLYMSNPDNYFKKFKK